MSDKIDKNDLYSFIDQQLPIFDEILAKEQKPLHQRPLAATLFFVTYCIVKIKYDGKIIELNKESDYCEQKWFNYLYKLIKKWYINRYSDAMNHNSIEFALGVVLIYDTPFQLKIPLAIAEEKVWG